MQTQIITFPRLTYSLAEIEVLVGLSRSTLHRMVARGQLDTVKRGRRRLVPADQVERLCGMADSDHTPEAA
jgi:excisionase family DNA binding protein